MDEMESCVPPGFRFHPTEEELVGYYLNRKVNSLKFDIDVIIDIDLYRMEPWDIQDKCKLGYDEQKEWYFFSHKDRKYPTGTRTNRATAGGFWKATGRDKAVLSKDKMIGMRKTLVFYRGRAPNGRKSDWIMHEYRLQTSEYAPPQEEGWVVCRAFKKPSPSHKQGFEAWNHQNNFYYITNNNSNSHYDRLIAGSSPIPDISSPTDFPESSTNQGPTNFHTCQQYQSVMHQTYSSITSNFEQDLISSNGADFVENQLIIELPRLDSPSETRYDEYHEIRSNNKWEILDTLLGNSSELLSENTSFSDQQSMMKQSISNFSELEVHNQLGSYMECFPNL